MGCLCSSVQSSTRTDGSDGPRLAGAKLLSPWMIVGSTVAGAAIRVVVGRLLPNCPFAFAHWVHLLEGTSVEGRRVRRSTRAGNTPRVSEPAAPELRTAFPQILGAEDAMARKERLYLRRSRDRWAAMRKGQQVLLPGVPPPWRPSPHAAQSFTWPVADDVNSIPPHPSPTPHGYKVWPHSATALSRQQSFLLQVQLHGTPPQNIRHPMCAGRTCDV